MPENKAIALLLSKGIRIRRPDTVWLDDTVVPERIAPGVLIHPGCRLSGKTLSIGSGCVIGEEGPATLDNCQLGPNVRLASGTFTEATFLEGASLGGNAHVRPGTLLEEEAAGAHSVGLKQTVLFPYVVLGSLINFCDCLMAGGTSREDHGEVGSSYVHFNFTPHRDKATASLIGDVPRGVMLDRPPIFLGGQGGLVGPARIEYGVIVPAGTIIRKDILQPGLAAPEPPAAAPAARYRLGAYRAIRRIVLNNLIYLGNICALDCWYRQARALFMTADPFLHACHEGALARLTAIREERLRRLDELALKMPRSLELARDELGMDRLPAQPYDQQKTFAKRWPRMREQWVNLKPDELKPRQRESVLAELERRRRGTYRDALRALSPGARTAGVQWLQAVVDNSAGLWRE
ncbi:MAG: UDP-N-acetylglucosamine pyrophosphorylase [Lentisphaerae bacterium]|nr:UDP-N-acetylglucosamine pyrophosphorylase [Lentisphaerota bacterium]